MHFGYILLTLFFITSLNITSSLIYEEREYNSGLIFVALSKARVSYDSYSLIYHVDISRLKNLTSTVATCIESINLLCGRLNDQDHCRLIKDQLADHYEHMARDELDIESYQQRSRSKRAIEWIGSFFNWAFGLLDADSAREYDEVINNLGNNTDRQHNLIHEQATIIKEQINLNNYTFIRIVERVKKLKSEIFGILMMNDLDIRQLNISDKVNKAVSMTNLIIMQHQKIAQQILHCLENGLSGKITQLIPATTIASDLSGIEKNLKDFQKLPIDGSHENPLHIFNFATIISSLYGTRLLIKITFPIIDRDLFSLYQIIAVPTKMGNLTIIIKPSTKYVLINNRNNEYIPITMDEMNAGRFNLRGEKVIKPAENIHRDYSKNCEVGTF